MKPIALVITAISLFALGIALPLAGIEQFAGDFMPVVVGLVCLAGSAGACTLLLRPAAFEHYVKIVSMAFVVLAALGTIGYMTDNGLRPAQASAAMTSDHSPQQTSSNSQARAEQEVKTGSQPQ